MSHPLRTIRNNRKAGLLQAWHDLLNLNDTKAGRLVGIDTFGNKYFEDRRELPLRERWVNFTTNDYDSALIEPGWHSWLSHLTKNTPELKKDGLEASPEWIPRFVPTNSSPLSRYKPYNTTLPKYQTAVVIPLSRN